MKIIILFVIIMLYSCFFNPSVLYANEHLVSRQHFLSEVTNFYFSENILNIEGWAFKRRGYHYKKESKHQYDLHLVGQKHYQFKLNRIDTDLTSIMEYRGAPFCEKVFNDQCNYLFTSVGFKGELNLGNIEPGTYKVLLELRHPDKQQITTQLFLDHNYESAMTSDGISYKSNGILDNGRLKIIYHTLLAAKKPLPSWVGGIYQAKHSCDEYFETDAFFQQDSVFNHIKSKNVISIC